MGKLRDRGPEVPADGPDWTDVFTYVREIEKAHTATITLEVFTDGRNYVGTGFVRAKASVPRFNAVGAVVRVEIVQRWPSNGHKTMPGLMLALLYQLDHKIGSEGYSQRELPF